MERKKRGKHLGPSARVSLCPRVGTRPSAPISEPCLIPIKGGTGAAVRRGRATRGEGRTHAESENGFFFLCSFALFFPLCLAFFSVLLLFSCSNSKQTFRPRAKALSQPSFSSAMTKGKSVTLVSVSGSKWRRATRAHRARQQARFGAAEGEERKIQIFFFLSSSSSAKKKEGWQRSKQEKRTRNILNSSVLKAGSSTANTASAPGVAERTGAAISSHFPRDR